MKSLGPPSSPPTAGLRRAMRIKMASKASIQKMVTENPKLKIVLRIRSEILDLQTPMCNMFVIENWIMY